MSLLSSRHLPCELVIYCFGNARERLSSMFRPEEILGIEVVGLFLHLAILQGGLAPQWD